MKKTDEGTTWGDLLKNLFPDFTDEQRNAILFVGTSYPFGSLTQIRRTLQKYADSGKSFHTLLKQCAYEFDKQWEAGREERENRL